MASLSEYFKKIGYKPIYYIGDRVFGYYNGIPFIGSVGNDTIINEDDGPYVTIHLDLPLLDKTKYHSIIKVKHVDIRSRLRNFDGKNQ